MRDALVYWREVPIDVENGVFKYIDENWDGEVMVVSFSQMDESRKHIGWETSYKRIKQLYINKNDNIRQSIINIIKNSVGAIHLLCGTRGYMRIILEELKKWENSPKVAVIAERPTKYINANPLERFKGCIRTLYYKHDYSQFNQFVSAYFAMGLSGVAAYDSVGWSKDILFNYMYCPLLYSSESKETNSTPKILYLGRFEKKNKGLDLLMDVFDDIDDNFNYQLDLVGGYGKDSECVINWVSKKKNVKFIGKWDPKNICDNISKYDVCIVPSHYDGWNLMPNQAICSSIGTIITNNCGSDELIRFSGAGMVVEDKKDSLCNAVKYVLEHKEVLDEWKSKAKEYRDKISWTTVGKYFMDVLDYVFYESKRKPVCPWI